MPYKHLSYKSRRQGFLWKALLLGLGLFGFSSWLVRAAPSQKLIAVETCGVVTSLAFSPDSGYLACTCGQISTPKPRPHPQAQIWNKNTGKIVWSHNRPADADWGGLAFSSDGEMLVTSDLNLWDVKSGKVLRRLHSSLFQDAGLYGGRPAALLAFWPNDRTVAVGTLGGTGYACEIFLFERQTGALRKKLQFLPSSPRDVFEIGLSPDGKTVITAVRKLAYSTRFSNIYEGGEMRVWSLHGKLKRILKSSAIGPGKIIFSSTGKFLATINQSKHNSSTVQLGFVA